MVQLLEKANQFITKYAVLIIMLTACYCFFQFFYPYHLFFREQIQLFLFTPDFFYSCFDSIYWRIFNPTFLFTRWGAYYFDFAAWTGMVAYLPHLKDNFSKSI